MRINVSFKDSEKELIEFLNKKAEIIGVSAYIKQLIYEKMLKEKKANK